jgi:hypothetical protein
VVHNTWKCWKQLKRCRFCYLMTFRRNIPFWGIFSTEHRGWTPKLHHLSQNFFYQKHSIHVVHHPSKTDISLISSIYSTRIKIRRPWFSPRPTLPTERNLTKSEPARFALADPERTQSEPRVDPERTQSEPRANAWSEPRYLLADPASGRGFAIV